MAIKPKFVTIGGHKFVISEEVFENPEDYGLSDDDTRTIKIKKGLEQRVYRDTLIHEVIHQALAIGGISYSIDGKVEEGIVRCLEHLLIPALEELKYLKKVNK